MTTVLAAVGFLWPFADAGVGEGLILVVYVALILGVLPLGWTLIKRTWGLQAAGPLWPLLFFMALACAYALATPPWQTPDEPRHMEYTELVRRGGTGLPSRLLSGKASASDLVIVADVDRRILTSLRDVETWPDDTQAVIDSGAIPGPVELTHPVLYYATAAAVSQPLGDAPIVARLAVLRALGVMVTGWVVWMCGCAGRILWRDRPRLAETPMAIAAAVPTFAAFSGTVNSDVMANLCGAALLVVVLLIVRRTRPDWAWIAAAIAITGLGISTKRTFLYLVPVLVLGLVLRLRWRPRRLLALAILAQAAAGGALLALPLRPVIWTTAQAESIGCEGGRIGDRALCGVERGVTQSLTAPTIDDIEGHAVTVGFFAYADGPARVTLYVGSTRSDTLTIVRPGWTFGRVQFVTPDRLRDLQLSLVADAPARVDGVVLARGRFTSRPPRYLDARATAVRWDGRTVENLLENGSAEDLRVRAPSWLPSGTRRTLDGVGDGIYAVSSGERAADSWSFIGERLGETFGIFWGSVGWDQPPRLLPSFMLWALAAVSGLGLLAAALSGTELGRRVWPGRAAAAMVGAALMGVFAVVIRGVPPTDRELVSGRYLFPDMVAISTVLVAGWRWILSLDDRRFRSIARWSVLSTHAVFLAFVFVPFRWQ